jgi:hypothetical protein
MSTVARTTIGFDRSIDIEWLDAAAARVARGEPPEAIRKFLWDFLEDVVPGNTHSSGRGKTLTVLTRTWVVVPQQAEPLRKAALRCIVSATGEQKIAIHWAMVIGTHPFFCDIAANVGKLLTLNGQANRFQIKRRMTEVLATGQRWSGRSNRCSVRWCGGDCCALARKRDHYWLLCTGFRSMTKSVSFFYMQSCWAMGTGCRSHS